MRSVYVCARSADCRGANRNNRMQIWPAIARKIQCDSVELIKSRTSGETNNNTANTANASQNVPQSVTHGSYEVTSLEELGDEEELPF